MRNISLADLGRLYDVARSTVTRWNAAGHIVRRGNGSVDLPSTERRLKAAGLGKYRENPDAEAPDPRSLPEVPPRAESQARLAAARASQAEDELRLRRGHLVPVERVAEMVAQPLEAVRTKLENAPRRFGKRWSVRLGIDQGEAIGLLKELCEDLCADLRSVFE